MIKQEAEDRSKLQINNKTLSNKELTISSRDDCSKLTERANPSIIKSLLTASHRNCLG